MNGSSALMAIAHIFFCYILFSSFNKPFGYGAIVAEKSKSHTIPSICSGPETGLRVVHKYGPCSPFGLNRTAATSSQILVQDEHRVHVLNSRSHKRRTGGGKKKGGGRRRTGGGKKKGKEEAVTELDLLNDSIGAANYLVEVGFGTPAKYFNLALDTGSYITWVRCQRCTGSSCPQQHNESLYYPSSSSTSSNAPCYPLCTYTQPYLDHSYAIGFFVADTVSIEHEDEIPGFVFLCSDEQAGDFGKADGILGLGLGSASVDFGSYSLTSMFDNVFCHCLPTSDKSMGYVYFGDKAHEKCPFSGSYTPLLTGSDPSLYFVNLIAITIGQTRVEISSDGSSPRAIIDSGTVITRLPSSVYSALRTEFQRLMSGYPSALPDHSLDTCYNLEGYNDPEIPMVLHFENLDVSLDQAAVTSKGNGRSQVCLAFAEKENEDDLTIIGNHQQQNLNILYNIPDQRVEIGPGSCL
ncbi:putative Eukaryotic aspartyl protease family protein [Hibiscus syriacus]|uniref:Eukaryotic aspartyl protease family protein n=1 Tax=Hibiscus syriacus TaxID=106335 RepID=A0A6A3CZK2_HIBSY|nr:aspartyl protease family protein At5g10770-like [Hibiscus syriacus]KAE8732539.1 putative Eukaryotic aspartyl protease family protein [Hibiscus syriacus]